MVELPDAVRDRVELIFPNGIRVLLPVQGSPRETSRLIREVAGC